ncbi:MAG: GNAT family N-acetyltransferase [Bacteroidetes bacterium]|nr:GNAT family N-acetyltransferase [Bacteroidota bacterium]
MSFKYQIRPIKSSDLPELIELCRLHAEFEKSDYKGDHKAEALAKHLFAESPSLYGLVIEGESKLLGYSTFMPQFATWDAEFYLYMDCLYIRAEARSKGIGEALIARIKMEAVSLNCKTIQWQTPAFNKRAMKFYERLGAYGKDKVRYFLDVKT